MSTANKPAATGDRRDVSAASGPASTDDRKDVSAANTSGPIDARGDVTGRPQVIEFVLRGEFIALDALLKATGLVSSGGHAKSIVADGQVQVNGQVELRKTCKIRAGQAVALTGVCVYVLAAPIAS